MKVRPDRKALLFYAATVFVTVVIVFSLAESLRWVNRPFPGFLVYHPPYAGSFSSRDWAGKQAGVRYLDRVLSADGAPVRTGRDILEHARGKDVGAPVEYVVESKAGRREVTVPVSLFSLGDYFLVFFTPFFSGLAIFVLGVVVYVLKPNTRTSWVFFAMCCFLGLYGITGFEIHSSYRFVRVHYLILCLFPACFLHLGMIFPQEKRILSRRPWLQYLPYVPALAAALLYQLYFTSLGRQGAPGWLPSYVGLSIFARYFTLIGFLGLIALVLHSYFRATDILARQRAKMMILGVTISFIPPGLLTVAALALDFYFPFNLIPLFTFLFPLSIGYSIVRHNLFEAGDIIRRTVGYVLVTAVVVGAYAGVSVLVNLVLGGSAVAQSRSFPILFTLAVILVFNPLRDRLQAVVDRLFFRKEYDYGQIVEKIGGAMTSLLDLGEILRQLTQTLVQDLFVDTSAVLLLDTAGTEYRVSLADGDHVTDVERVALKREDPLMAILEREKREITRYDVAEDPHYRSVSGACAADFDALHSSLVVPLVFQEKVIGAIALGVKKSGKPYNREDVELFRTLAKQGTVAILNARLFKENLDKQRMEEELAIARDLQMSMLPAAAPKVAGIEVAAMCTPAKEVGGDFFDFIEAGEERLGIIVGDVTGKSVSGALVMAASRSVFRILAEEESDLGAIMVRANRRIKKDIKSGMFVALLYAEVDGRRRTLKLCSAGQTQPVRIPADGTGAELVQTNGDTFPLGIIAAPDYQETVLNLERGECIVLYTDGIVEAMNGAGEMFGFDRLLAAGGRASRESAEGLLHAILDEVNAFVGAAPQHDDLTAIVLRVAG